MSVELVENPAKRGDLIVVERVHSAFYVDGGSKEWRAYEVGIVVGVKLDGSVSRWKPVGGSSAHELASVVGLERWWVSSKGGIDIAGALAAAREHSWPGHPDQPRPFDSIDEVRALLRPYRKEPG